MPNATVFVDGENILSGNKKRKRTLRLSLLLHTKHTSGYMGHITQRLARLPIATTFLQAIVPLLWGRTSDRTSAVN
jgi:hypothetical protein